jgi:hypothetical protein
LTATEDRELRRALHGMLQSLQPPPVPLETITRRSKRIRLRRAGAAVATLGLAGVIAVASLALRGGQQPEVPPAAPAITARPDGVFASGVADGHPWRLAVQNIADPGYRCLPGITINGSDADWVYPDPGGEGVVGLGPALPGFGLGFIQLPADINGVIVNGHHAPAVAVTACGDLYRIVGFAYSLAEPLQVTVTNPPPGWSTITMPVVSIQPPGPATTPENPGLWINTGSASREAYNQTVGSGALPGGQGWIIKVQLGTGGECYEFDGSSSLGSDAQMGYCGPVSTPDGPETIMALPLGFPSGTGATGYAVQVSPRTARVEAILSDGSTETAALRVVDGRKYAALVVPSPLTLSRLIWIDARGRVIASTTGLPMYGYVQFQP